MRGAKGGLFSVALAEIIGSQRKEHDTDGDGVISISELYRALKAKVIVGSNGQQTPWLSRNKMVGDFGVF